MNGHSIDPRFRGFVWGYGFLCFAKNISENVSGKYSQKLLDYAIESTTEPLKTASKRVEK